MGEMVRYNPRALKPTPNPRGPAAMPRPLSIAAPVTIHAGSPRSCRAARSCAAVQGALVRGRAGPRADCYRRQWNREDDAAPDAGRIDASVRWRNPLEWRDDRSLRSCFARVDDLRRSRAGAERRAHDRRESPPARCSRRREGLGRFYFQCARCGFPGFAARAARARPLAGTKAARRARAALAPRAAALATGRARNRARRRRRRDADRVDRRPSRSWRPCRRCDACAVGPAFGAIAFDCARMTATPKVLPAPVRADAADAVLPGLRWALARDIKLALRSRTELA